MLHIFEKATILFATCFRLLASYRSFETNNSCCFTPSFLTPFKYAAISQFWKKNFFETWEKLLSRHSNFDSFALFRNFLIVPGAIVLTNVLNNKNMNPFADFNEFRFPRYKVIPLQYCIHLWKMLQHKAGCTYYVIRGGDRGLRPRFFLVLKLFALYR